ncbi:putative bifunctional diguanylate cyclase/phosphodiesterase [Pseudoduganella namucuonensis]|uniref:Diguanylate cyclase (GGDEF) domain-containing protein n=1 Tax=Pseudoduganella namucuonensis TaxID=1035707 RepID=A0A1I7LHH4_9BURK|nr:EAL domain-containing protein [Pseudoduganella namucuonensis]SFV09122.1 diguanylate cyclase (GGDEF) domain-containing protein [Pseudoduganella namucuonensis]
MANPADDTAASAMPLELRIEHVMSELERVNRAHRTLNAGNRTLLRASNEQQLLDEMCRVIVEPGGYLMACVAYAVHDEAKSVRWRAGVGIDVDYLDSFHFTWADTEWGGSLAGAAIRGGQAVVDKHITDAEYAGAVFSEVLEDMVQRGVRAATAFPLRLDGEVLGALLILAAEPDAFDQEEVALLGELADDLAFGIATLRTRALHGEAQRTIARLAYRDTLTGLANRTLLVDILDAAMHEARRQHRSLALLHLNVGHFHEINKMLGYRAGDELMRSLALRLPGDVPDGATLARVGEAAFALLLPSGDAEYARQVAQQLLEALDGPVEVAGLTLYAQVGIGIALFPGHAADADVLIRRASAAMDQVRPGRSGYAIYTAGQEQESTRRLALLGDLNRAIKDNELRLYCQPKVDIPSGSVCGAEALVRWIHPRHGMISTTEFIQLAEQAGTITPLTNWMLEAAFSQCHAWHEAGLERALAVNLSAHDLYDQGLVDRVRGMFSTWGVGPELIQFELTEGTLMADPDIALATLFNLKNLDVQLFIDDYGTGYSSLSYLRALPVDALKIDRSFVTPMTAKDNSAVIVNSTIELGHNLDLKIVAEGVESQDVWEQLAAAGCDVAQGFLISRPMPADEFLAWDAGWRRAKA